MKTFKVLQFNMQFGQIWDATDPDNAPVDLNATIAEILSHDADIVLLQEVERARPGGEQIEPPPNYTRLRDALSRYEGYFAYPKADPRELPFGIGLAILSKAPVRDAFRKDLPSPPVEFEFDGKRTTPTDRLLIGAKTQALGRDLNVFNTHLLALFMLNAKTQDYPTQRRRVLQILRERPGPALIGGDFNVVAHDGLARQFATVGFDAVQTTEPTWRRAPYVLDHVFYNSPLRCVRQAVKPTLASDHHAVVAEFEFADGRSDS
jgi:endonuclease/exonuclease/phosphatase family metal-dependent hydrolase